MIDIIVCMRLVIILLIKGNNIKYSPEPLKLDAYSAKLTLQSHSITLCVVHSDKLQSSSFLLVLDRRIKHSGSKLFFLNT